MSEMYMNGHGIQDRTCRLNDALFDKLLHGIFGGIAIILGPFLSWGLVIHRFPWEEPVTQADWVIAVVVSLLAIIAGGWGYSRYSIALRAVKRHMKAMEEETSKRGKGWARS